MSILKTYVPIIDINPAKKSLLNQAGSSYNAVATGDVKWTQTRKKSALKFGDTGVLTVTRDATLDAIVNFTILVFGDVPNSAESQHLFNKGTGYQFYFPVSTGYLSLFSGATDSPSSVDTRGARMVGVSITNGQKPKFYKNGSFTSFGSNALTMATNTTNVAVGNYGPGPAATYNSEAPTYRILFFNQVLSDQVISQIYDEVESEMSAGNPKVRNFQHQAPPIDSNCVLAYDMATRTGDGKMADLSGSGRHGTIYPSVVSSRLPSGFKAMSFNNAIRGIQWTPFSIGTVHTLEWLHAPEETEYEIFEESTNAYFVYVNGTGTNLAYAAGGTVVSWTIPVLTNKESHLIIDRSGTRVTLYVDGVSMGDRTLAADNPIVTFTCLNSSSAIYSMTGKIGYCQLYSTSKGATWASNRYKRYAKSVVYDGRLKDVPPSLRAITAGEQFEGSEAVNASGSKMKVIKA
jgi:hypothetical protein